MWWPRNRPTSQRCIHARMRLAWSTLRNSWPWNHTTRSSQYHVCPALIGESCWGKRTNLVSHESKRHPPLAPSPDKSLRSKYLWRTAYCSHNSLKCQGACLDCRSSLKGKKQRDRKKTGEEFKLARVACYKISTTKHTTYLEQTRLVHEIFLHLEIAPFWPLVPFWRACR